MSFTAKNGVEFKMKRSENFAVIMTKLIQMYDSFIEKQASHLYFPIVIECPITDKLVTLIPDYKGPFSPWNKVEHSKNSITDYITSFTNTRRSIGIVQQVFGYEGLTFAFYNSNSTEQYALRVGDIVYVFITSIENSGGSEMYAQFRIEYNKYLYNLILSKGETFQKCKLHHCEVEYYYCTPDVFAEDSWDISLDQKIDFISVTSDIIHVLKLSDLQHVLDRRHNFNGSEMRGAKFIIKTTDVFEICQKNAFFIHIRDRLDFMFILPKDYNYSAFPPFLQLVMKKYAEKYHIDTSSASTASTASSFLIPLQ